MGGAFTAVEDELSALAWNPACLAPPEHRIGHGIRTHVNLLGAPAIYRETGLLRGIPTDEFEDLPIYERAAVAVGSIAKAVTFRRGGLAAGVLLLEERLDPGLLGGARGLADAGDLLDGYYSEFAVAFRLAPTASLGFAQTLFAGRDSGGGRTFGMGRVYGAALRPNEFVTVGFTYFDLPEEFADYRQKIEGIAPRTMNAGIAYRPFENGVITFDLRDLSERHPETSLEPRVGLEWNLWGRLAVRAGGYREEAGETNVLTLGLGVLPMLGRRSGGDTLPGDDLVLNYAVLLSAGETPRHLLSVLLHF